MSNLKSYEVIVTTSGKWYGTVQALSLKDAKRIGEEQFDEGSLTQCGEDVVEVIAFKPRSRAGSWTTFERKRCPAPTFRIVPRGGLMPSHERSI